MVGMNFPYVKQKSVIINARRNSTSFLCTDDIVTLISTLKGVAAGKASYATLVSSILLAALIVLFGSTFGPVVMVNPYDLLGFCIAIVVLLYVIFYYYYNRIM